MFYSLHYVFYNIDYGDYLAEVFVWRYGKENNYTQSTVVDADFCCI